MLSKKRIITIISIIYWGLIFGTAIGGMGYVFISHDFDASFKDWITWLFSSLTLFFIYCFFVIMQHEGLSLLYFLLIVTIKKFYK